MKIFDALFYPLVASLLLLPSDGGAQRDNSEERNKQRTNQYLPTEVKRQDRLEPDEVKYTSSRWGRWLICAFCETLFINVTSSQCTNFMDEAVDICKVYIIETKKNGISPFFRQWLEKWKQKIGPQFMPRTYLKETQGYLRDICRNCVLWQHLDNAALVKHCVKLDHVPSDRCERLIIEMPNTTTGAEWNQYWKDHWDVEKGLPILPSPVPGKSG